MIGSGNFPTIHFESILYQSTCPMLLPETGTVSIIGQRTNIAQESVPLWIAGLKIWPLVSILSFTIIPVESRIVFGSVAGVVWGIYLSLFASQSS